MGHRPAGILLGLWLLTAGVAEACTAESTVDIARASRDASAYPAARDIAESFIDQEGFTKDTVTIESGTGTLLLEAVGGSHVMDTSILGKTTTCSPHAGINSTVTDHLRYHLREWDDALNGKNPELMDWWTAAQGTAPSTWMAQASGIFNIKTTASGSEPAETTASEDPWSYSPPPSSEPAPAPLPTTTWTPAPWPALPPAPVSIPVPAPSPSVDHAG